MDVCFNVVDEYLGYNESEAVAERILRKLEAVEKELCEIRVLFCTKNMGDAPAVLWNCKESSVAERLIRRPEVENLTGLTCSRI